uniref:AAA_12 domain-containing protein n=1 Tax=Haemonchus contortus TaxID=6289 RepID=A0A7I4Z6Y4_HAECO
MLKEQRTCDICLRLGKSTAAANPVYDLVSRSNIFGNLCPKVMGDHVVNLFYANQAIGTSDEPYLRDSPPLSSQPCSFLIMGPSLTLPPDQEDAVRIGSGLLPLVAIQAAYGTRKTLVGSLIPALASVNSKNIIIVTTSTNAAVAQFTEIR